MNWAPVLVPGDVFRFHFHTQVEELDGVGGMSEMIENSECIYTGL